MSAHSKLRILTVVGDLGLGGTQRAAQNFALGYHKAGHDSAVLALNGGGQRANEIRREGVRVIVGGQNASEQEDALLESKAWMPHVVHIHRRGYTEDPFQLALRSLKSERNLVVETNVFSRVDYSNDRNLIDIHFQLSRWCLWKWSCWSSALRPRPFGVVVPYGVRTEPFYPIDAATRAKVRAQYNIPEKALVFGRIGQNLAPKWSTSLIQNFASACARKNDIYLFLVGAPESITRSISQLPTDIRSRFVAAAELTGDTRLREAYGAMDVFLHDSSIGESFGMVLAEAMLCCVPVITKSTPLRDNSQLEVVGHQKGGLVVNDDAAMIQAMHLLAGDAALRERLGKEGRRRILSHYNNDKIIQCSLALFECCLVNGTYNKGLLQTFSRNNFVTKVEPTEILSLMQESKGGTSLATRLLMKVIHLPWVYQLYAERLK